MPTPKPRHRTYCKTCEEFTIHSAKLFCESCDTRFTSYFPNEVDSVLIDQQRKRYSKQRADEVLGLYGKFIQGSGVQAIIDSSDEYMRGKIIECDAGQKQIDDENKKQREEFKRKGQEILDDYNNNYKHLNRNEKCSCGSEKKFKQCHLLHFKKYLKI